MKYYAGIGSRSTPLPTLQDMTIIAEQLEKLGYILRSGGADGADSAFEKGVDNPDNAIILRPKHATKEAMNLASTVHPAWHNCNEHARKLHGRNCQIILGENLQEPAEFVVCYTPSEEYGGTSLGIRLARRKGILVYNLFHRKDRVRFLRFFGHEA